MNKPRLLLFVLFGVTAFAVGCSAHLHVVDEHHPGEKKVVVCHKGKTLEIGKPALEAHLKHGDTQGPCP